MYFPSTFGDPVMETSLVTLSPEQWFILFGVLA